MADKAVTIRTRKFMTNRLLSRKQFVSSASFVFFLSFFFSPVCLVSKTMQAKEMDYIIIIVYETDH